MISPRDCEASLEEYELTSSFTAGAEGYCAPNVEPVISKSPSIQNSPTFEVYWEDSDTENPRMWPLWYKGLTVIAMSLGATAVSLQHFIHFRNPGNPRRFQHFQIGGTSWCHNLSPRYGYGKCSVCPIKRAGWSAADLYYLNDNFPFIPTIKCVGAKH